MESARIGIFLEDKSFAHAMAKALARECRAMSFRILDAPAIDNDLDLILSSTEMDEPKAVQFVRERSGIRTANGPPYRIYLYQDSQNLIRELLHIYYEMTGKILSYKEDRRCRLAAFVAGGGGWGTTSLSIAVCYMLYRIYSSRCLYLNLCPIDDSKKYLVGTGNDSFLKLLYYLEQERDFPLDAFITSTEELDYLDHPLLNCVCDEMDIRLLRRFLRRISKMGTYDFVILDMSNHLSRTNRQLLQEADIIVEIFRKVEKFGKYFSCITREIEALATEGSLIRVENFAGVWEEDMNSDALAVSEDHSVFNKDQEDCITMDLTKNYGAEIGAIAKRMVEVDCYGTDTA
ncbi:hypothetical protein ACPW7J_08950 [Ihubacter sp. rT4E-8]|uniref:hypothetical protein n=1 Tax=Ihubacter sp. rT4E-8 TaxID=3242369 RepID=UPI003CEBD023